MDAQSKYNSRKWTILVMVVLMTFMSCIDSSIVNVALPIMAKKLNTNMASIELVVTCYLIVISALVIIFGRISDIKGKKLVFMSGIAIFTLASLLCGISASLTMLIFSRVLQAVGAACTMSANQGIITQVFPANERGRALGINGASVALGLLVGPPLGGLITQFFSWHYIFFINIPIGVITFVFCLRLLPKMKPVHEEKFDYKGAILFFLSVILLFSLLDFSNLIDFNHIYLVLLYVLCAVLIGAFVFIEKRTEEPLLHLKLFKNKLFSISIFCSLASFLAMNCITIIIPFYFMDVMKLAPGTTGLFMMFSPLMLAIIAPLSGYLSDKIGSEKLTFFGLSISIAGYIMLAFLSQSSTAFYAILSISIVSVGNAIFQSPNTSLIMSTVPHDKLGVAGSINALVRNLGQISGVIISTGLLYLFMGNFLGYKVYGYVAERDDAFVYGMHFVFSFAAVVCVIGATLTAIRLMKYRRDKQIVN